MRGAATSSISVLRALVAQVQRGVPAGSDATEAFLTSFGIGAPQLADVDARVPFEWLLRAWQAAPTWTADDDFGLHFAEQTPIGSFDVLDYATRSCATLGDAFQRLARYQRLLHDAVTVTIASSSEGTQVVHRTTGTPRLPRHAAEAALASWLLRARSLTERRIELIRVDFQHAKPTRITEHRRIFGAPLRFEADANRLVLSPATLDLTLKSADRGLCAVLDRHAEAVLARRPVASGFVPRFKDALAEALREGRPTLREVSSQLHMSDRSVQRLLAQEGTRFTDALDAMRSELAVAYMREPEMSIGQISFLLGFSEPSAFHRAFRRWTKTTPKAYRAKVSGVGGAA